MVIFYQDLVKLKFYLTIDEFYILSWCSCFYTRFIMKMWFRVSALSKILLLIVCFIIFLVVLLIIFDSEECSDMDVQGVYSGEIKNIINTWWEYCIINMGVTEDGVFCWDIQNWTGKYHHKNGNIYIWEFKDWKRNWYWVMLYGSWSYLSWDVYKWFWKDNQKEWSWVYYFFDWSIFTGTRINWKPNWYAEVVSSQWTVYKWEYKNWMKEWYWVYDLIDFIYEWEMRWWYPNWKWKIIANGCSLESTFKGVIAYGKYVIKCNDVVVKEGEIPTDKELLIIGSFVEKDFNFM